MGEGRKLFGNYKIITVPIQVNAWSIECFHGKHVRKDNSHIGLLCFMVSTNKVDINSTMVDSYVLPCPISDTLKRLHTDIHK